jgi:hypothetical protein
MSYTNSKLVKNKILSPNHSGERTHSIDRITIHCVVGQTSMASLGNLFKDPNFGASCNYGVCTDGIVLIVEEKNRSWCSSSEENDQRAITIETASNTTHPYKVRDNVYTNLLELVYDICKRNGKDTLLWFDDKDKTLNYKPKSNEMVLTVHRWFANKSCPGDYLYNKHSEIAKITTERLQADKGCDNMGCPYWKNNKCTKDEKTTTTKTEKIKAGDLVKIVGDTYYNGQLIPTWVKTQKWYVHSVSGDRAVINKNQKGTNAIMSPINVKNLKKV